MKKLLVVVLICALACVGYRFVPKGQERVGGGGPAFSYTGATQATSSVGRYAWVTVMTPDSTKQYATVCNDSIVSNDAVYLGFGATSTMPYGYRLPSGQCYEMNENKLFYGTLYAIASSATTTILTVKANNY